MDVMAGAALSRARSPAIHALARVITVRRGWWPFGHHDVSSNADTICRHRGAGGRRWLALRNNPIPNRVRRCRSIDGGSRNCTTVDPRADHFISIFSAVLNEMRV